MSNNKQAPSSTALPPLVDDEFYDLKFVCQFFGGPGSPVHEGTVYRAIKRGILAPPVHPTPNTSRWLGRDLRAAKQAIIDRPRDPLPSPKTRVATTHGRAVA